MEDSETRLTRALEKLDKVEQELPALRYRRDDQPRFHYGKRVADAHARYSHFKRYVDSAKPK